jgi:hypothetical protein
MQLRLWQSARQFGFADFLRFVAWFIGTGPGIFATARSDCGLAGGCGANQALANLCGVRGPWTGWQRCS